MTFSVIAAVKDAAELRRAPDSVCPVVFLLFGSIVSAEGLVQQKSDSFPRSLSGSSG